MTAAYWIVRIIAVVALLCVAAAIATPKGRLPLALRGLQRLLRKERGMSEPGAETEASVSAGRRLLAFVLVVLAAVLCMV